MYRNNNNNGNYNYEDHYSRSAHHRRPVPGDLDPNPNEQYYSSQPPMTSGAYPVSYPSVPEPHQPRTHANVDSNGAGYTASYSNTAYDPAGYHDSLRPEAAYNNPYGGASTPVYEPDQMHMYSSPAGSHSYSALYPETSGVHDESKEDDAYLLKPIGPRPYANSLDPSKVSLGDEEMGYPSQNYAGDTYALNTYEEPEDLDPEARDDISLTENGDENGDEQNFYTHEGQHIRRHKTLKRVRLFRGNLVLDCPISQKLLSQYPSDRNEREFTHMRYSAATCDPADFVDNGFTLRQMCYQQPRTTELFIVVTMYNEDEILLGRTLKGVFKNIAHLMSRKRSNTWGADAWKKVVVCVVSDGRQKINPRSRALLAAMGVYQEGFAKNIVNDKPVSAHIYEYTTLVGINSVGKNVKLSADKAIPVQMLFCLKEKNQKKINSHRWFFQAFCPILRPNVCILLDAGTQPGSDSIYHLWKSFDTSPNIGGACGEIKCMLGTGGKNLINPLVAAQNFEYKMSNILDKPLESVFGFISVLPGAFSAYKYEALLNDSHGEGPLEKYFKGETLHDSGAGIFTANMYLAEDRILCFELVAKRNSKWLLRYVKSAYAETDVPDGLAELILQRRRWLNGSFFAGLYGIFHVFNIWRSSHSFLRKLWLHLEFFYQSINLLISWFAIGNFFLIFQILTHSLGDPTYTFPPGKILSDVLFYLYSACLVAAFVLSFGNRPQGTNTVYVIMVTFFAVLMIYLLFAAVWISVKAAKIELCLNDYKFTGALIFRNSIFRNLVISMLSTYALYILSSLLFFEPWHMITSFAQYMLLSPSYVNVLNVYAFCNIHDISWGTKGDTGVNTDLGIAKTSSTTGKLEVEIPTEQAEIDAAYMNELEVIANRPPKDIKPKGYDVEKEADYYALIRTTVVLLWMFTNIAIVAYIRSGLVDYDVSNKTPDSCGQVTTTADSKIITYYLAVLMYTVAGLAAFRFIGSCTYLVARLFGH